MRKKILGVMMAVLGLFGVLGFSGFSESVWAAGSTDGTWVNCTNVDSSAAAEAMCNDITDSSKNFSKSVQGIFGRVFGIAGILAVVGVIYSAFILLTASGDPAKVKKGKDALRYSVIGLIVVALSWAIVSFVIANVIP